jgi:hypothetical protein
VVDHEVHVVDSHYPVVEDLTEFLKPDDGHR